MEPTTLQRSRHVESTQAENETSEEASGSSKSGITVPPSLTLYCVQAVWPLSLKSTRTSASGTPIPASRLGWDHHGTQPRLGPSPVPTPATLQPCTKTPGRTMTEQFEWTKGGLGSLTYLVEPALGWKNGNVTVKTSAGTTGHVGTPNTSSTVSGPRSSRTKRTSPSGSCSDCFRCSGASNSRLQRQFERGESSEAPPLTGGRESGHKVLGVRLR